MADKHSDWIYQNMVPVSCRLRTHLRSEIHKRLSRRFWLLPFFFAADKPPRMFSLLSLSTHSYLSEQLALAESMRYDRLLLGVLLTTLDDDRLRESIL